MHDSNPMHDSRLQARLEPGADLRRTRVRAVASRWRTSGRHRGGVRTTSSRVGGRWSRSSTPAAARTRGSTPSSNTDVELDGTPIGYTDGRERPRAGRRPGRAARRRRSTRCPGHGTFIAGLVHQTCPDADIVAWRVVPSRGSDRRVGAGHRARQIAELARRYRAGRAGRTRRSTC